MLNNLRNNSNGNGDFSFNIDHFYKNYLKGPKIFKHREALEPSFIPDDLPHRDAEVKNIAGLTACALRGDVPPNFLCYGMTGTGKTGLDTILAAGASCTALITRAVIEDECQFALIGVGERLIPHTQDHECALSIPASKIEQVLQGLQAGHSIGVFRYPIPAFLRYSSQHPPGYAEMRSHLLDAEA